MRWPFRAFVDLAPTDDPAAPFAVARRQQRHVLNRDQDAFNYDVLSDLIGSSLAIVREGQRRAVVFRSQGNILVCDLADVAACDLGASVRTKNCAFACLRSLSLLPGDARCSSRRVRSDCSLASCCLLLVFADTRRPFLSVVVDSSMSALTQDAVQMTYAGLVLGAAGKGESARLCRRLAPRLFA